MNRNAAHPVLRVSSLSRNFGGLRALNDVDLDIRAGEIVALIGPNGAGKTTFFNCVTGIYVPTEGDVFACRPGMETPVRLNGMKPFRITELGLARTFQNIRLFPSMTVLENVMIGRHCRTKAGILGAILRDGRTRAEEQDSVDRAYDLLRELNLAEHWKEEARNLPYGAQRRLEIARALATRPRYLICDEVSTMLDAVTQAHIWHVLLDYAARENAGMLLVSHTPALTARIATREVALA